MRGARPDLHQHLARIGAGAAHRISGAGHALAQIAGFCLDEAEQALAPIRSLPRKPGEDGGEDTRHPDGHMHLLRLGAPAALGCDTPSRRRAGLNARGSARGPVLNSAHQCARQNADGFPRLALTSWGQLGRAGSRRLAVFLPAHDSASDKIIRREQHRSVSKVTNPMCKVEHIGGGQWTESHPRTRVNHPREFPEAT